MLCRYDTTALKSLDIFSVHGFPVGLIQCESNFLGIKNGSAAGVGSGGWSNIIEKFTKAKLYCDAPFEVRHVAGRKTVVPIEGEWIGERRGGYRSRSMRIECLGSADAKIATSSLDAVLTDPPYFGNVQYGELMDFCHSWLKRLAPAEMNRLSEASGRLSNELTGNSTQKRDIEHFAEGLAAIYGVVAKGLKPGAPLAFTFHHNRVEAYQAVGIAILDAGLVCTASPPCAAEMSGSIHISGTGSSIVNTVFCRSSLGTEKRSLKAAAEQDIARLIDSGMRVHRGDVRCVVTGHATRIAIAALHHTWNSACDSREVRSHRQGDGRFRRHYRVVIDRVARTETSQYCAQSHVETRRRHAESVLMQLPFEAPFDVVEANLDSYVEAVFEGLQSEFLTLPKGPGFIEYDAFEHGYEQLKRATRNFKSLKVDDILKTVCDVPIVLSS